MEKQFFFAQKAFIVHNGRLLAIRKSDEDPNQPGLWEVPGGRMDFGEEVDAHLAREVMEEVGLPVVPGPPFHVWQWQLTRQGQNGPKLMQIVAVARLCSCETTALNFDGRQIDDYLGEARWLEVSELDSVSWIPNMLPVLQAFRSSYDAIQARTR
ncbi:MAG TPA: NUDIX domain-containing protein [Fimbriimonadaceae bacterium]|nr:NUDIX domain-containing protein [Fimbriimonadaceae bacterium]